MNIEEFKIEYIQKAFIQEKQFYQWMMSVFKLNIELNEEFSYNSSDLFVVKFVQFINEGENYCKYIMPILTRSDNNKIHFFQRILDFILSVKSKFPIEELDYLEYRRHNICHIFQNGYEVIQSDLKIKSKLKNRSLEEINNNIINLLGTEENEFKLQKKLFKKYYIFIEKLRTDLQEIQKKYKIS